MLRFEHHTDAEQWVRANAVGPVGVIDSWTYGRMEFYPFKGRTYTEGAQPKTHDGWDWRTINHRLGELTGSRPDCR